MAHDGLLRKHFPILAFALRRTLFPVCNGEKGGFSGDPVLLPLPDWPDRTLRAAWRTTPCLTAPTARCARRWPLQAAAGSRWRRSDGCTVLIVAG